MLFNKNIKKFNSKLKNFKKFPPIFTFSDISPENHPYNKG